MEPASIAILLWIGSTILQCVLFILFMRKRRIEVAATNALRDELLQYRNQMSNISEFFELLIPSKGD